jgi:hypothetical protein
MTRSQPNPCQLFHRIPWIVTTFGLSSADLSNRVDGRFSCYFILGVVTKLVQTRNQNRIIGNNSFTAVSNDQFDFQSFEPHIVLILLCSLIDSRTVHLFLRITAAYSYLAYTSHGLFIL